MKTNHYGITSLLLLLAGLGCCEIDFSTQNFNGWAESFGQSMREFASKTTAIDDIRSDYLLMKPTLVEVNGSELIRSIKSKLQDILNIKIRSVKELVKMAEDAFAKHEFDKNIEFPYFNSKKLNNSLLLQPTPRFNNIPLNLQHSTVHVPTNVYDESVEILNGVKWSKNLDEAFVRNHHNDPTSAWQYFCSAAGFFRFFPGNVWNTTMSGKSENYDTFDCRVRDWYLQAAAFPKDLVILLDVSGSMRGLRSQIAKATVEKVLDTLNDDDFFNIIKYSDELEYLRPCFNGTLIQATDNNKIVAKTALEDVETLGIAQLGLALEEGFDLLSKFQAGRSSDGVGSSCNQAIVVVSDGANEKYQKVFEDYNMPNKNVRVFTYLIGREVSDKENIKWIACHNKGRFSHITSLADVHEHVQEYIHVMSRPMVISRAEHSSWTNVYSDSHNPGLGMMTSISKPVYDRREDYLTSGILLGVMGTDVPLSEITELMPNYKFGVNAFSFAITSNGYALFHPKLKPRQPNLSDYGGAFNAVDLSDLEPLDLNNELRHRMIQRETGSIQMTSFITHDHGKRGTHRESTYYFTDVKHTPFSISISLPEKHGKVRVDGSIPITKADLSTLRGDGRLIAPWSYCKDLNSDLNLGPLGQLIKLLEENQKTPMKLQEKCDMELVESLLFDIEATKGAVNSWIEENWASERENSNGIEVVFMGTKAGLTRFQRFLDLTDPFFIATNYSSIEESYYQRAVENGEDVFTFSVPFNPNRDNLKDWVVTASSPLIVHQNHRSAVAAVVGFQMRYQSFYNFFLNHTSSQRPHSYHHDHPNIDDQLTCHTPGLKCFLLDENAYVVLSRNPHDVGSFFGLVPGMKDMMEYLIIHDDDDDDDDDGNDQEKEKENNGGGNDVDNRNHDDDDDDAGNFDNDAWETTEKPGRQKDDFVSVGVYRKLKNLDSQAICQRYKQTGSAASVTQHQSYREMCHVGQSLFSILCNVFINIPLAIMMALAELLGQAETFESFPPLFEYDLLQNDSAKQCEQNGADDTEFCDEGEEGMDGSSGLRGKFEAPFAENPCTHLHTFYRAKHQNLPITASFSACQQTSTCSFSISHVAYTNLMLLVMDEGCTCHASSVLSNKPIQLRTGDGCDQLQLNPERRGPDKCYAYNAKENSTQCGGGADLRGSHVITLFVVVTAALV